MNTGVSVTSSLQTFPETFTSIQQKYECAMQKRDPLERYGALYTVLTSARSVSGDCCELRELLDQAATDKDRAEDAVGQKMGEIFAEMFPNKLPKPVDQVAIDKAWVDETVGRTMDELYAKIAPKNHEVNSAGNLSDACPI